MKCSNEIRIICECQRHAQRERTLWRRSLRMLKRRGVAWMVGVPVALSASAFGIPFESPSFEVPRAIIEKTQRAPKPEERTLPIFTTDQIRAEFLAPQPMPRALTLDAVKEEFFRNQVPYGSIIYREALRNNLSPELVAAVVHTESDFRPRLVSNKSAHGLMQIIPSTGRLLGADDLFDPEENIAAGTKYLRRLMNRFGDTRIALAAYNAGEGNVEKFGGIPPFPETINYLQRVNARTAQYRARVRRTYFAADGVRPGA